MLFQVKPKRIRKNPTRKWNAWEETVLLNFLMENPEVEVCPLSGIKHTNLKSINIITF